MKKPYLRNLALILVLVLAVSSLSACSVPGNTTTTEAPTQAPTEAPTEAPTQAPTEAPTDAPRPEIPEGSTLYTLPEYTYDSYKALWNVENGAEILLFNATSPDGYTNYLTDLENAGFTKYAENEIVGNLFSTWTNDELHVTMMYIPSQKSTRILAEPSSITLPTRQSENIYEDKGIANLVAQVGTNYDGHQNNGMCYIYRLCDGSFILADSGFNSPQCADAIYNTLVKLAPDPNNIVIAAWFLSHAHNDHVGGFYAFSTKYHSKVKVEQVVANYPTERVFSLTDTSNKHISRLTEHAALYDGCKVVEAHPGQEFFIRDAYIEMLYTWDMFTASVLTYMNNTSLVFTINFDDTKIMQLGDCGPLASPIITNAYGEYIKSDYIQVAHHGYIGASAELNNTIAAPVVMWPASNGQYRSVMGEKIHAIFRDTPYLYVADTSLTIIPIPFDPEKVEKSELYAQ